MVRTKKLGVLGLVIGFSDIYVWQGRCVICVVTENGPKDYLYPAVFVLKDVTFVRRATEEDIAKAAVVQLRFENGSA